MGGGGVMMTDITPSLRRQAVREIMDESGKDLDWFAEQIGFHTMTTRVWLNRLLTDAHRIDRAVDAFLARNEKEQRNACGIAVPKPAKRTHHQKPADGLKRCARCGETKPRSEFGGTGYCLPCQREYFRARDAARKAARAQHDRH